MNPTAATEPTRPVCGLDAARICATMALRACVQTPGGMARVADIPRWLYVLGSTGHQPERRVQP